MSVEVDPTAVGRAVAGDADIVPGRDRIGGYDILAELGRGARAVVYRVRRAGHDYALKLRRSSASGSVETFRREAALLAGVRHPGVAKVHEVGAMGDRPYLIMDLVDGPELAELLRAGPLPESLIIALGIDLVGALAAAHRIDLVHRDVKPRNILLGADERAVLIDFGLATRAAGHDDETAVGTWAYSSPEQAGVLNRPVDGRSDLYSLGAVLFECATGTLPFTATDIGALLRLHATAPAPNPRSRRPELSAGLAAIITRLLAKDPDDRYPDAEALLDDLYRLSGTGPAANPTTADPTMADPTTDVPLRGRAPEYAELLERWHRASRGFGGIVLVHAPAGGGKSRLVRELLPVAQDAGWPVLHGKSSRDDKVPLGPIRDAVDRYVQGVERLPEPARSTAVGWLRRAAGPSAGLLAMISPTLTRLFPAVEAVNDSREDQFRTAVAAFLVELARAGGGAVLHLDDVQWLDAASLAVLDRIAGDLAGDPLLVLATARDDADSAPAVDSFRSVAGHALDLDIALPPLEPAAVVELAATQLPGATVTAEVGSALRALGGGNPFTVLESVRAIVDAGLLEPRWGSWMVYTEGLARLALPGDAVDLVLTRLRDLSETDRELLVTAAAVGTVFDAEVVTRATGTELGAALETLARARRRSLVERRDEDRYAFVHDRIREALLSTVDGTYLCDLHQRIAESLRGSTRPADVYAVAHHRLHSDPDRSPELVFEGCVAAAQLALRDHAPGEALRYLDAAATAATRARITLDGEFLHLLGIGRHRSGDFTGAVATVEQALRVQQDPIERAILYNLLAEAHVSRQNDAAAVTTGERGLAELGRPLPRNQLVRLVTGIGYLIGAVAVRLTGIGFGTIRGEKRELYRRRGNLYRAVAMGAVYGLRPHLVIPLQLRGMYLASRLGRGVEYLTIQVGLAYLTHVAGLYRVGKRMFAAAARSAAELRDPYWTTWVAFVSCAVQFESQIDDGSSWRRLLDDHGRWLDVGVYFDGIELLCFEQVLRGNGAEARRLHGLGRARLRANPAVDAARLLTQDINVEALLGPTAELDQHLRGAEERLAGELGRPLRATLLTVAMQGYTEAGELGEAFNRAAADFAALKVHPRVLLTQQRAFYVYQAYGRLAQCRAAASSPAAPTTASSPAAPATTSGPAALAAAEHALRELRRAANRPILRAHRLILEAELRQLRGEHRAALRYLARHERFLHGLDAPLIAYEAARVRAHALHALGHHPDSIWHARFAAMLADEHGWIHRVRRISQEFGVTERATNSGSGNGSSMERLTAEVYRQRLVALEQVSLAASRVVDPTTLARVALDELIRILGAERGLLFLTDGPQEALAAHLGRDAAGTDLAELTRYSSTLVHQVANTREAAVVTGTDEGAAIGSQSAVAHGLRSIMAAPVQLDGRLLGVVYLDSRLAKGIFTTSDVGILTALANHIAVALETARAAQLEVTAQTALRQRDLAEVLHHAMRELTATLNPAEVIKRLLRIAETELPGRARLLLADGTLLDCAGSPLTPTCAPTPGRSDDLAFAAVLRCPSPTRSDPATPLPPALGPAAAWLAVPFTPRDQPGGVLLVTSTADTQAYTDAHLEIAAALVGQGAVAYENATLFAQVRHLAATDPLTGLYNRRRFFELGDAVFRHDQSLSAVMLDIDHFKQINDSAGHQAGDEVIRHVAARLRGAVKEADIVARYGGEEFAVLLPNTDQADAEAVAERIRAAVATEPVHTSVGPIPVTVSVGVTHQMAADPNPPAVLSRADTALYRAKQAGRNRVASA